MIVQIGTPAVESLIVALKHENWRVREIAIRTLASIAGSRAVEHLSTALRDSNIVVRENAARGLGEIGAPAAAILIAASQDVDVNVRKAAAKGIEYLYTKLRGTDEKLSADAQKTLEQLESRGDYERPKPLPDSVLEGLRRIYG